MFAIKTRIYAREVKKDILHNEFCSVSQLHLREFADKKITYNEVRLLCRLLSLRYVQISVQNNL